MHACTRNQPEPPLHNPQPHAHTNSRISSQCDDLEDELATSHEDNRVLRKRLDALTAAQLHGAAGGLDDSAEAPPEKWMLLDFLMQLCQSPGDLDDDELCAMELDRLGSRSLDGALAPHLGATLGATNGASGATLAMAPPVARPRPQAVDERKK